MQVYRHMDIGSAKITPEEMQGILIICWTSWIRKRTLMLFVFRHWPWEAMERIYANGKSPWWWAEQDSIYRHFCTTLISRKMTAIRLSGKMLEHRAAAGEGEELHRMLQACDPKAAEQIHPHNVKRVIRALEYYRQTGRKISDHNEAERQKESPYKLCVFCPDG